MDLQGISGILRPVSLKERMRMKKTLRRIGFSIVIFGFVYFAATAVATRNYWAGLWWSAYLSKIPCYDLIQGPRETYHNHIRYANAKQFILKRILTPATAQFCPIGEAKFGTYNRGDLKDREVMLGYLDAQNSFGATIRQHFIAVYSRAEQDSVERVRWAGKDDSSDDWW